MNEQIKEAISFIDEAEMNRASRNNFRIMYAGETGYEVKQNDVLYIIEDKRLQQLKMDDLELFAWHERDDYCIEDKSSVNYYLYKPTNRLVLSEMSYQFSHCVAYFRSETTISVPAMVRQHKQHYIDIALLRKLRIDNAL